MICRRFDIGMLNFMIENVRNKLLTHLGSIELQAQLEVDPIILPSIILQEVEENTTMICLDIYGNYVCQKLVSFLSTRQLGRFIESISENFEMIATSVPGSCVISSLMETITEDDWCKASLLKSFEESICRLICDPQGSHLLQLAINSFEKEEVKFIHKTVEEYFFIIATDRFGCCLIKKIIEKGEDFVYPLVLDNLFTLSNDQFGNYIVQYFFDLKMEPENHLLIENLIPKLEELSKQKYGSNVLEKIIDECEYKRNLIINLLTETEDQILELAQNKFGNYVLQKCLELVGPEDKIRLFEKTKRIINEIQNENIKARIEGRLK